MHQETQLRPGRRGLGYLLLLSSRSFGDQPEIGCLDLFRHLLALG